MALHVQDKRLVMLGNLATLSFAIHNGRPDVYEPTGEVVMQFGLKLIF